MVDDRSEDGTGEIVRGRRRRTSACAWWRGSPLPEGWLGKPWALHQGARAARGEWLLFVDADTRLRPGAVAGALEEARRRGRPC